MNVLVIAYLLGVASPTALNFDGVADPLIPEETPLRHDHNQLMQIDAVLAEAGEGTSLRHESSKVEERTPSTVHERRNRQSDGVLEAAHRASEAQAALRASQVREGFL